MSAGYWEQKRYDTLAEKITVKLFKIAKNKKKICGYVRDKDRNDLFGNFVCMHYGIKLQDKSVEIFEDRDTILNDLRKEYDLIILFEHKGGCKENNITCNMIDFDTVVITMHTKNEQVMNEDLFGLEFYDERAIYNIEDHFENGSHWFTRTPKMKYKHLLNENAMF